MIRAVLFDLDNTLIDFMGAKMRSCEAAIDAMVGAGLKMEKKKAIDILFGLYNHYGIEYKLIFQKFLFSVIGKMDMKILAAGIVAYREVQATYHKPYQGVLPLLAVLRKKGLKLGIVSDAPVLKAWLRLTEMGAAEYFDVVVAYTGKRKPHPLPFRKAIKALEVKPEDILFVGDDPRRDTKGAKALGMKTALAKYGLQDKFRKYVNKYKADYELARFKDLLEIV
ncbi:MAG: HAD-IA family hydrolase [Candidatus Aenigmarchaeota archaeon]|nr:HAD-IA family hydrolase [Candidatus Aenigmarchaeota archaeon]